MSDNFLDHPILSGRGIIPPADRDVWPAREYLAEHRKEWRLSQKHE